MKVVLALVPVWDSQTPPLALAFLKSSLAHAGYDCSCIDFSVQFRPIMVSALGDLPAEEYIATHPNLYKSWAKQIAELKPTIVGFSLLVSNLKNTAWVASELKKILPEVTIVSGGPSLTRENQDNLEQAYTFSDYIIEGEGEHAIVNFVRCFEHKEDITKLKQLWLKNIDGSLFYTGPGIEQNIDTIPLPDFTDFNMLDYPCKTRLPILFSRGCILNCNYCENKWNHLTQRSRTGNLVFKELKRNVNEYGIKEYMFNDDSLISFKTFKQLEDYCDLTIAEGLIMPWSVYGTRVERKLTDTYVAKLRKSGMWRVSLGVESFSSKVQHDMGKSSRFDDADKTCRMFSNQGIKTESWIIYGYPTESDEDFADTLNWFVKNPEVLSHITANTFGPNAKYLHDKPNMIQHNSNKHWDWTSKESTLEKRKERFLQLIDVLETTRRTRKGNFTYHVGDPLYVKYFSSWTSKDKSNLFDRWNELEGREKELRGIRKWIHTLSPQKKHTPIIEPEIPQVEFYDLDAIIASANTLDLRERLNKKIEAYVNENIAASETAKQIEIRTYLKKIDLVLQASKGKISENAILYMSLQSYLPSMLKDLVTESAEELCRRMNEQVNLSAKSDAISKI